MRWLIISSEQTTIVKQCDNLLHTAGQIVYHHQYHGRRSLEEIKEKIQDYQPNRIIVICHDKVNENHSPLDQTLTDQLLIPVYICQTTISTLLLTFSEEISSIGIIQDATKQLIARCSHVFNARLINPISNDDFNERSFLSWKNDPTQPHHIAILSDLLPILIALAHDGKASGQIDICNKGTISFDTFQEILSDDTNESISSAQDIETSTDQFEQWNHHLMSPSTRQLYQASFVVPKAWKSLKEYFHQQSMDHQPTSSRNLLVTGGCGFIGSTFINHWLQTYPNDRIINIDRLDPVANPKNISNPYSPNYTFILADINNTETILHLMRQYHISHIVHFAVQAHLDTSFGNSLTFTESNIYGTHSVLEASRIYGHIKKFLHFSTDEVYGETPMEGCQETHLLNPINPYAATIAAAEFLVKSYGISFKLPYSIIRLCDVYGPRQHLEKVIPKFIQNFFHNEKVEIQGDGAQIRHYIYIDDVIRAIEIVFHHGKNSMIYNVGTDNGLNLIQIAKKIFNEIHPEKDFNDMIIYTSKKSFQEKRYSTSSSAIKALGWTAEISFDQGLQMTIEWYRSNADYWKKSK